MGRRGPLATPFSIRSERANALRAGRGGGRAGVMFKPKMPSGLSSEEQTIWRSLVPRIARLGILREQDTPALRDLVRCQARLEEAEANIAKRGLLVPGDRGRVKNPAIQVARGYRESLVKLQAKFGLTPGDRERMQIPEPRAESPESELDRLLAPDDSPPAPREDPRLLFKSDGNGDYRRLLGVG